jgi:type I restriction enzyme S subunit
MYLLRLWVDAKSSYPKFIYFLVNTPDFRSSICQRANKAVNQASINQTELGRTVIPLPSLAEQQKISDCLSSLDEKIAAETQKLGALKTHKKGLMQQLFPVLDEVGA